MARNGRFLGQDIMKGENPNISLGARQRTALTNHRHVQPSREGTEGGGTHEPEEHGPREDGAPLGRTFKTPVSDLATPQIYASTGHERDLQPQQGESGGTSIFDPVLTELAYRWFCPRGGRVLDPFAGGSVRGIVASRLGLHYAGIDLRGEQIAANREQASRICRPGDPGPLWLAGDSREVLDQTAEGSADMILTCPPYGDLERYSEDPRDISQMVLGDFDEAMRIIILKATRCLAQNRFSVWIASDYRLADGRYALFPSKIRLWHEAAGMKLYNEAILLNAMGSLPIRAGKQFQATRKLGRAHQEILIFLKGDEKAATSAMAPIDIKGIDDALKAAAAEA
jgi:hypothetical protein